MSGTTKLMTPGGGGVNLTPASSIASDVTVNVPSSNGTLLIPGQASAITSGTAVAATSGTSIDFTGIPSWVKRITVMFNGVSTNGTSIPQIQFGSGAILTSGYTRNAIQPVNGSATLGSGSSSAPAVLLAVSWTAQYTLIGSLTLVNITGNTWVISSNLGTDQASQCFLATGANTLSGVLDRLRITTVNGTDTFDGGSINILYE